VFRSRLGQQVHVLKNLNFAVVAPVYNSVAFVAR